MARKKQPGDNHTKPYRSFWDQTGRTFPSLTGAPSTGYYRECEQTLFREFHPDLHGKKVLKTDLWDEAKNTQILHWVESQGAGVYGLDISTPMVEEARNIFHKDQAAHFIVSDLRRIAFTDNSFDVIYSMGTIEHFRDYALAVAECYRVLKPGGMIFMGVPNKLDPFLRPLLVWLLRVFRLYSYGYERSFRRKALAQLMEEAGFEIQGVGGVLFMPGILRMLDLWFHVHIPAATKLTSPLIAPFVYLYRKFPSLRRHSYLVTSIAQKPL
jgi:SAM-dependent methyltransferase